MKRQTDGFFERFFRWLAKYNWQVVSSVAIFLVIFEIVELFHKNEPLTDPFHWVELIIYFVILILVGVLVNFLLKANRAQNHTMEILKYKHDVSIELGKLEDWDMLTNELVRLPSRIATVEACQLQVHNSFSNQLEIAASWSEAEGKTNQFQHDCKQCLQSRADTDTLFNLCTFDSKPGNIQEYCLPISHGNGLFALLQFRLRENNNLSSDQKEIFENIGSEISLALKASREQKLLSEMRITEMTLAERHSLSTYLHDHLSQNLAYLCLKLEQLTKEETSSFNGWKPELQHMKDAANQSYDIVRGKIEVLHPETTPRLVNLLSEHAKRVARRSHIEVSVEKRGNPLPISPKMQQAVFYVFQEALANVEKHAKAQKVTTLINWGENELTVTIKDDGIGFTPQKINGAGHLGLEIMHERINKVHGRIDIQSHANSGTEITIFVPVQTRPVGESG